MMKLLRKFIRSRILFTIAAVIILVFSFSISSFAYIYDIYDLSYVPKFGALPWSSLEVSFPENDQKMLYVLNDQYLYPSDTTNYPSYSNSGSISDSDSEFVYWYYNITPSNGSILRAYDVMIGHAEIDADTTISLYAPQAVISSEWVNSRFDYSVKIGDPNGTRNNVTSCVVRGNYVYPHVDQSSITSGVQQPLLTVYSGYTFDVVPFSFNVTISEGSFQFPVQEILSAASDDFLISYSYEDRDVDYLLLSDIYVDFQVGSSSDGVASYAFNLNTHEYVSFTAPDSWSELLNSSEKIISDSYPLTVFDMHDFDLGSFLTGAVNGLLEPNIFGVFSLGDLLSFVLAVLLVLALMRLLAGG